MGRYVLVFLRVVIGLVYIISGMEKLLQPSANFLYIIQGYDMVPWPWAERAAAAVFPWVEFFLGGFLILGFWTRESLLCIGAFSCMFIAALTQAMVRKLPLADCGCFGDLVGLPLWATLLIDIGILSAVILLLRFYDRGTRTWVMDNIWK